MRKAQRVALLILRLTLGWLFFYAGITKVLNPVWSAEGYLTNAQTFAEFFAWFAQPYNLVWVNQLTQWGLTLVGAALILGFFVKYASYGGIAFMILFWFPVLSFPLVGEHSYIVDDHIIYIAGFLVLIAFHAGRYWGLDGFLRRRK